MMSKDLHPNRVNVYGWVVLVKSLESELWEVATDEKYPGLPEHHEFIETAMDSAYHLRRAGILTRVCGLLQEPDYDNHEGGNDAKSSAE